MRGGIRYWRGSCRTDRLPPHPPGLRPWPRRSGYLCARTMCRSTRRLVPRAPRKLAGDEREVLPVGIRSVRHDEHGDSVPARRESIGRIERGPFGVLAGRERKPCPVPVRDQPFTVKLEDDKAVHANCTAAGVKARPRKAVSSNVSRNYPFCRRVFGIYTPPPLRARPTAEASPQRRRARSAGIVLPTGAARAPQDETSADPEQEALEIPVDGSPQEPARTRRVRSCWTADRRQGKGISCP